MYRDLGTAITRVAKAAGCSVVTSYCGHGIHRLFHCAPNIPHYAKNKAVGVMKPGGVLGCSLVILLRARAHCVVCLLNSVLLVPLPLVCVSLVYLHACTFFRPHLHNR